MKFKPSTIALLTAMQVSGCSSLFISDNDICFNDSGKMMDCSELSNTFADLNLDSEIEAEPISDPYLFKSNINFQLLSEYIEQMAVDIKRDVNSIALESPIAVTSFVSFDSSLKNTSILGNHIGEYFINELKSAGLPVNDYKVSGLIKATPNGDYSIFREIKGLKKNKNVGYVLTGTLVQHERGIMVNARVVSLLDNNIIASNSKLIPRQVVSRFN